MIDTEAPSSSRRVAGSFRDPAGYVFRRDTRLFRAIDSPTYNVLCALMGDGRLPELIRSGRLVPTRFVDDEALAQTLATENPGYEHFLEHDVLWPITYPYEWSVSMLADAALCTLDVQEKLLASGYALKDATAYNIQFPGGRPCFIDVSSIEKPARLDLWFALGQFHRMFTYPLLLCRHHGWDLRSYFLARLDGRSVEEMARIFRWTDRLKPGLLMDFTLPWLLSRKADRSEIDGQAVLEHAGTSAGPQLMNLQRLRGKVRKLAAGYRPAGVWATYTATCSYDKDAEHAKKEMVRRCLERAHPSRTLDIGCNTGDYSYIAAEAGADVIAADSDHDAVEMLYRRLRTSPARITPMVVDLGNPSPAIGYRNEERAGFLQRLDVDCVLALALIHHLLVSANLSLSAIRDLFHEMTREWLILEYVPTDDSQFRRLLKFRVNLFGDLTLDLCRRVFTERFDVVMEEPIPNSPRTLLLLHKK